MQSGSGGVGFTEDVSEFMVVWWNASHVDWSIIGGSLVGKKCYKFILIFNRWRLPKYVFIGVGACMQLSII